MNGRRFVWLGAALCLSGCVIENAAVGPVRHESRSFARDASEILHVDLKMGAGELRVNGGSPQLAEADFTYNVASWKPDVRYSSAAGHGNLTIEQPGRSHGHIGNVNYEWDLRLNNQVPMEISVHFGAGEARMDLGSVRLRRVDVEMGVGKLEMDLRGRPQHNYDVRIRGGVGEATVRLPANVGIYAKGSGGIGEIHTEGLRREGEHWINDAYDHSKVNIHLDIQGGIGAINLIADSPV